MPIVIVADFQLEPGAWAEMDRIMREHARLTLEEESGCERFDVLHPKGRGGVDEGRLMLVEQYRDKAAVDAHLANPRLARVRESYAALVKDRTLTVCNLA